MTAPTVEIHYRRPPDRVRVYEQRLLVDGPDVKITYQPETPLGKPLRIADVVVLEPGSPAVWFTFPGVWHDIGRFHTIDGAFTGLYANILTPPVMSTFEGSTRRWDTTDLFLDVWSGPGGHLEVLDRHEFDDARRRGWIDDDTAADALAEVDRIVDRARRGLWPPPVVEAWSLERARVALR